MTGMMDSQTLYDHVRQIHVLPAPSRWLRTFDDVKRVHTQEHRMHPWTHSHADVECMADPTENRITIEIDDDTFDFIRKGNATMIFEFSQGFGGLVNAAEFGERFGRAVAKLQEMGMA